MSFCVFFFIIFFSSSSFLIVFLSTRRRWNRTMRFTWRSDDEGRMLLLSPCVFLFLACIRLFFSLSPFIFFYSRHKPPEMNSHRLCHIQCSHFFVICKLFMLLILLVCVFVSFRFCYIASFRYKPEMELEDAIHTAILTMKEGFEGAITENNIEVCEEKRIWRRTTGCFVSLSFLSDFLSIPSSLPPFFSSLS